MSFFNSENIPSTAKVLCVQFSALFINEGTKEIVQAVKIAQVLEVISWSLAIIYTLYRIYLDFKKRNK